jgi:ribosomal-protein-alanine N-acetyltransferase
MPERLPYIVEPMRLADVEQVLDIERVAFPAPWSARAYRYEITENEHSTMIVVRFAPHWARRLVQRLHLLLSAEPSPVLGYAGFWLLVDDAHISTIAVHPEWRHRGLGELLLLSLLEQATKQGAQRATLEVRVSNQEAQGLYHKYGFEVVSRRRRYYSDNNEDAFIMATPPFETHEFQENLRQCRDRLHTRLQDEGVDRHPQLGTGGPVRQNRPDRVKSSHRNPN